MTSQVGRLYALTFAIAVFFVVWAVVAARPWAASKVDSRLQALAAREALLRREGAVARRIVAQRTAAYHGELPARRNQIATARRATQAASASPPVRVVTLPPLTITRTS
jgi:hypothetical protein